MGGCEVSRAERRTVLASAFARINMARKHETWPTSGSKRERKAMVSNIE